ncbi:Uncharacterised protein [uncultured Clostridium sp.]|nr:Uncharacterised protein [uncultured Clostridium sp.]
MKKRDEKIENKNKQELNNKEKMVSTVAYRNYYPNDKEV